MILFIGLSYTIDNSVQTCTTQNITDSGLLPIDYITSQGKVQEISPAQLFYATDTKYEYLGEVSILSLKQGRQLIIAITV